MRFAPVTHLRARAVGLPLSEAIPVSLRIEREALRLRVLLGNEPEFGFDSIESVWWLQVVVPIEGEKGLPILFLLDGDFPVSPPLAMMLPQDCPIQRPPVRDTTKVTTPEGWTLFAHPVPCWRPNDDLMRPVEWLRTWISCHPEPVEAVTLADAI